MGSIPITSPVDFISGPKRVSEPRNLVKGRTDSFTAKYLGSGSAFMPCSFKDWPIITFVAIFASGRPVAFEMNGTVLDARGFTSRTKSSLSLTANCILRSPLTPSSSAMRLVLSFISESIPVFRGNAGITMALSPE